MPADVLLAVAGVTACRDAGVDAGLASALVWQTPPRGSRVKSSRWRQAREIFAAELKGHGWRERDIATALGVSVTFVQISYGQHVERFGVQERLLSRFDTADLLIH